MSEIHSKRSLPPLAALRAFEAAARHLSFQAAAAELAVTPSAVSHQVALLEASLGVPLFRRLNRKVMLTEAGRACLPGLSDGFDRLADAVARARTRDDGMLTVTSSPGTAAKFLMPRIERFRERHPGLDLRIDASMRLADFHRDDVHVGLRFGRGNYPGLHVEKLHAVEVFPVAAPELVARGLRRPEDLARFTLLHEEGMPGDAGNTVDWAMWLAASGITGVDAGRGLRFNVISLAMEAAIAGRGVLLARSLFAADDLAAGRLVRPFGDARATEFGLYFVTTPGLMRVAKVRDFRDWIVAEAAALPVLKPPANHPRPAKRRR